MRSLFLLFACLAAAAAHAGERASVIPAAQLQALDRAIARESNANELGSQTLGDLVRLRNSLEAMKQPKSGREAALEPLPRESSMDAHIARLEEEASQGNRASARSLTLYLLSMNNAEQARTVWRRMGPASTSDLPHQLIAAYIDLALGEYNAARTGLEAAQRMIDARANLELSAPVFCENIAGYRLYVPRPQKELLPGEETLIYVEVDGADFQQLADGYSECRIMFGLSLTNDAGRTLWSEPNYGEYAPVFNGPIRDLHTALSWRIPNDLVPGLYRLRVEAVEQSSKRSGERSMEFTVARRSTNPETRPGAGLSGADSRIPPGAEQTIRDAQKAFPGGPQSGFSPSMEELLKKNERVYELLNRHENMQRGDR